MSDHRILPAVPKRSTSSRCATGDGGFVPWRTQDAKEHRERMAQVTAPTPTEALIDHNIRVYRERRAADEEAERRRLAEMRAQIAREEERTQREIERLKRVKEFRQAEAVVDLALSALTPMERGRVNERLMAAGKVHDAELAAAFANEEILSRGNRAPELSNGVDWRGVVTARKK